VQKILSITTLQKFINVGFFEIVLKKNIILSIKFDRKKIVSKIKIYRKIY